MRKNLGHQSLKMVRDPSKCKHCEKNATRRVRNEIPVCDQHYRTTCLHQNQQESGPCDTIHAMQQRPGYFVCRKHRKNPFDEHIITRHQSKINPTGTAPPRPRRRRRPIHPPLSQIIPSGASIELGAPGLPLTAQPRRPRLSASTGLGRPGLPLTAQPRRARLSGSTGLGAPGLPLTAQPRRPPLSASTEFHPSGGGYLSLRSDSGNNALQYIRGLLAQPIAPGRPSTPPRRGRPGPVRHIMTQRQKTDLIKAIVASWTPYSNDTQQFPQGVNPQLLQVLIANASGGPLTQQQLLHNAQRIINVFRKST